MSALTPYVSEKISREEFLPVTQTRCFVTICAPLTRCLLLNCAVRCHTNKSPKMKETWNCNACCVICVGFMTSEKQYTECENKNSTDLTLWVWGLGDCNSILCDGV